MKNVLILALSLFVLSANATEVPVKKTETPVKKVAFKGGQLNQQNRVATLRNDTLWVHLETGSFKDVDFTKIQNRTLSHNGINYSYKVAIGDKSLFWSERAKGGVEIY